MKIEATHKLIIKSTGKELFRGTLNMCEFAVMRHIIFADLTFDDWSISELQ